MHLNVPDRARTTRAVEVATQVLTRVVDTGRLCTATERMRTGSSNPDVTCWRPASLALGAAGVALACGVLEERDPAGGWGLLGHRFLAEAVDALPDPLVPLSLFSGAVGVAAAAWLLSRQGRRYTRLLEQLDAWLLPRLRTAVAPPAPVDGLAPPDLFDGAPGWLVYLSMRPATPTVATVIGAVAGPLIAALAGAAVPRGGMAHGIPGAIAALAALHAGGVTIVGLPEAVRSGAERVIGTGAASSRPTWCTGGPGTARALWLAGTALDDPRYRRVALDMMAAGATGGLDSPTLCHGTAGLLLLTAGFAADTGQPRWHAAVAGQTDELLDRYDPASLFGYRDVEPAGNQVDNPGLLWGATGVALALLAVADVETPAWTRLFLLS